MWYKYVEEYLIYSPIKNQDIFTILFSRIFEVSFNIFSRQLSKKYGIGIQCNFTIFHGLLFKIFTPYLSSQYGEKNQNIVQHIS